MEAGPGDPLSVSVPDVLVLVGAGCIVSGVALWSLPAALIVAGVGFLALGLIGVVRA
jgi:hypothetical protein